MNGGRELYWEGIRRTDLVRFDLLTSGSYTWDFKGGINTGVGVNKRYNVYPIPVTDLTVNGNLQQNERLLINKYIIMKFIKAYQLLFLPYYFVLLVKVIWNK